MRSNVNVPAALDTARRLLECAQGPPYLLNGQDVPDLANLVRVLEELEALLPQVAHVRPWEGDAAVVVNGHVVYRFPDDDPAFSNTSQAVAERLARALGGTVAEVNLDGVEDWGQVEAALAARERRPSQMYVLINLGHQNEPTVLLENDTGIYRLAGDALGDLVEARVRCGNPDVHLYALSPGGEVDGPITVTRQGMYDELVALAWRALDKLNIADGIVDPYEDGTPFCADLCENLHDLLRELDGDESKAVEVVCLYAPDQGEVLIVNGEVIDTSEGTAPGDYIAEPHRFFWDLGRALGIHFTVQVVEVNPCALAGEYWCWDEVAAAWLSQRTGEEPSW